MASFKIHEDQENTTLGLRKSNTDGFVSVQQRRALGDLSHFACNQNRTLKGGLSNASLISQDENRMVFQNKNEKNIVPPVAQFRAFSVYEDNPTEVENKKREPTYNSFASKDKNANNFFHNATESLRTSCTHIEKHIDLKTLEPPRLPLQPKKDIPYQENKPYQEKYEVPASPMSVADTSVLSMSVSKNDSQELEDVLEECEETVKNQTAHERFFHVVEYQEDIYYYMREIEVLHRPNPRYMRKQPDITYVMRSILVDWLVEVCDEYGQQNETLHLAVSYVDRFLSYMSVVRTRLQLVGTAATYIAAKYEEVYPPEVTEFVYITDDTYTKQEVLRMEHLMLKVLSFDLSTPTSLAFLSHYCITNGLPKKVLHLASYIAELSLLEADPYLRFKPSMIAASSLATARHCVMCTQEDCDIDNAMCAEAAWPEEVARRTQYNLEDLKECMVELARTHEHASLQPYKAIPDKYKNSKFDVVASIEPRALFAVPPYQTATPRAP